jgi:hypothetical protein
MMDQNSTYDALDTPTLTNLLLNADQSSEVHRGALSALARRSAYQRSATITTILRSVMRYPERYDQEVMMALIDILATDPEADATVAMIEVLPEMLELGMDTKTALKPEFREYFYTALVTRQREDDLLVWGEMLPQLEAKALVAALVDPAAHPLDAIEPLTLMDRLSEPQRTKALISTIVGIAHMGGKAKAVRDATMMLSRSADSGQLRDGLNVLGQHWEKAKKSNRKQQIEILEQALSTLDDTPRSAAERLTGKRPWAP